MPELKIGLSKKANKNVRLYMAYHNIGNKSKAALKILEDITFYNEGES